MNNLATAKQKVDNTKRLFKLRQKLMAAIVMLVISSIMLVSTSFAWFVMSTAPEVSNIKTQVGSNGALEIALLNTESWNDLDLLDMGDIDESATESILDANLTWGNLVNLQDASYGLSKITLLPARLYIEESGTDESGNPAYKINSTILKTPIYGPDGRVQGLDKESAVAYIHQNNMFGTEGYGVRALGTSSTMSAFQLGMNSAKSSLITYMASARTIASNTLNQQGGKLANIVVKYAVSNQTTGYTTDDIQAVKDLAIGLGSSLESIETSIRYAFAGYITTEDAAIAQADYDAALAAILDPETSLTSLLNTYPGIINIIPFMSDYITKLAADQTKINNCIAACDAKTGDSFTWDEIDALVDPLLVTNNMLLGGMTIEEAKETLRDENGGVDMSAAINLVMGGINLVVPSGSGVLSDISDFAGNYTANVTIEGFTYGEYGPMNISATMATQTSVSPVYLTACGNGLKGATVSSASGSNAITDYYGYAIDLAFRTNAETSNLLLQTESMQRIYDDGNAVLTQGGGSYMKFTTGAGLSATKMVKLMSGIRVVFMDADQNVCAIAALDCTLGKDSYVELTADEKTETGMFAYLNGSASSYQNSDLITYDQYQLLPDNSTVVFNTLTGEITAKLYLYTFSMTLNSNEDKTGGITLGTKIVNPVITPLVQDVAKRITAVVYLDGSVVNNSMVAADALQSMTGVLNLQFSSDATLIPMENSALRSIEDETETEAEPGGGDEPGGNEPGGDEPGGEGNG